MNCKTPKLIRRGAFFTAIVLAMLGMHQTGSTASMDPAAKWAWSANAGWINFNPPVGGDVAVCGDHLEGYIWSENVGWIHLGTHTGGSPYTYANSDATNYGVNRDQGGRLTGYAWGANVGWINFRPHQRRGDHRPRDRGLFRLRLGGKRGLDQPQRRQWSHGLRGGHRFSPNLSAPGPEAVVKTSY